MTLDQEQNVNPPADDEVYLRYAFDRYVIRRQFFKFFGGAFHLYGPDGELLFYSKQKAFKLKEDIRLYTGPDMQVEALTILARQVMDISASYDVYDPIADETVGALQRRGLKSIMLRDEWLILDSQNHELGTVREDSVVLGLVRRQLSNLIPQRYHVEVGGQRVGDFHQHFNPFILRMTMDFSVDREQVFDRRLAIAAAVLICAIEGRQN